MEKGPGARAPGPSGGGLFELLGLLLALPEAPHPFPGQLPLPVCLFIVGPGDLQLQAEDCGLFWAAATLKSAISSRACISSPMSSRTLSWGLTGGVGALYAPVRRMEGSTSAVTHFRKGRASGLSDRRITAYRPLSLMMVISWGPPGV